MGTSLTTTNNAFRYPAGLVGEPPDVPDDIRKLAVDLDGLIQQGTWFPSLGGGSGATTGSSGGSDGTFLRIGKHISAKGRLIFGSSASFGTGTATISGLPGAIDVNHSGGYGWMDFGSARVPVMFQPADNANLIIRPIQSTGSAGNTQMPAASALGTPTQSSTMRINLDLTLT